MGSMVVTTPTHTLTRRLSGLARCRSLFSNLHAHHRRGAVVLTRSRNRGCARLPCRFPAMIKSWRRAFKVPDAYFGFVQLASWMQMGGGAKRDRYGNGGRGFAIGVAGIRQAQMAGAALPKVGYAMCKGNRKREKETKDLTPGETLLAQHARVGIVNVFSVFKRAHPTATRPPSTPACHFNLFRIGPLARAKLRSQSSLPHRRGLRTRGPAPDQQMADGRAPRQFRPLDPVCKEGAVDLSDV